ncbi:hypothetical protein BSKO_11124 [Bryopsis sp. KO-2023]|nr:hypothetical protein BSKO_11124 [Bryopsis sp. KO-2023]
MVKDAHSLKNKKLSGEDKMAAAVRLEMALRDMEHPEKGLLVRALQKRAENDYDGLADRFMNEMFITGEKIFMWFTPAKTGHHKVLFTASFGAAMFICFFFMCGEFDSYMWRRHRAQYESCLEQESAVDGPQHLTNWISGSGPWCFHDINKWTFSSDFMLKWGARYAPLLGESNNGHRWFTSMFIHQNFKHLFSNSLLFFSLAIQIEVKYGWWRICFLWFTSHMGGALFSAVLENPCTAVVGASGGVFGLMGLFIADMVLNFRTIKRPIFRGLVITTFLLYFVITGATIKHGTSHLSHLGGLVCGLFPSFLFLPKLKGERLEAWFPLLGGTVMLVVFITLPTHFYLSIVKNLECDEGK